METVSADNEGELTSTMGNVMSVPSKEEKNDTNDATPTSSTDANTFSAASHIVTDDPISSTSSDTVDQLKLKMDKSELNDTDNETDLLGMPHISGEKITEDVEDLVHDLESLLGEPAPTFISSHKKAPVVKLKPDESQQTTMETEELDTASEDKENEAKKTEAENQLKNQESLINAHEPEVSNQQNVTNETLETDEIHTVEESSENITNFEDSESKETLEAKEEKTTDDSETEITESLETGSNSEMCVNAEPNSDLSENKISDNELPISTEQCIQDQDITRSGQKEQDDCDILEPIKTPILKENPDDVDTTVVSSQVEEVNDSSKENKVKKLNEQITVDIAENDEPKIVDDSFVASGSSKKENVEVEKTAEDDTKCEPELELHSQANMLENTVEVTESVNTKLEIEENVECSETTTDDAKCEPEIKLPLQNIRSDNTAEATDPVSTKSEDLLDPVSPSENKLEETNTNLEATEQLDENNEIHLSYNVDKTETLTNAGIAPDKTEDVSCLENLDPSIDITKTIANATENVLNVPTSLDVSENDLPLSKDKYETVELVSGVDRGGKSENDTVVIHEENSSDVQELEQAAAISNDGIINIQPESILNEALEPNSSQKDTTEISDSLKASEELPMKLSTVEIESKKPESSALFVSDEGSADSNNLEQEQKDSENVTEKVPTEELPEPSQEVVKLALGISEARIDKSLLNIEEAEPMDVNTIETPKLQLQNESVKDSEQNVNEIDKNILQDSESTEEINEVDTVGNDEITDGTVSKSTLPETAASETCTEKPVVETIESNKSNLVETSVLKSSIEPVSEKMDSKERKLHQTSILEKSADKPVLENMESTKQEVVESLTLESSDDKTVLKENEAPELEETPVLEESSDKEVLGKMESEGLEISNIADSKLKDQEIERSTNVPSELLLDESSLKSTDRLVTPTQEVEVTDKDLKQSTVSLVENKIDIVMANEVLVSKEIEVLSDEDEAQKPKELVELTHSVVSEPEIVTQEMLNLDCLADSSNIVDSETVKAVKGLLESEESSQEETKNVENEVIQEVESKAIEDGKPETSVAHIKLSDPVDESVKSNMPRSIFEPLDDKTYVNTNPPQIAQKTLSYTEPTPLMLSEESDEEIPTLALENDDDDTVKFSDQKEQTLQKSEVEEPELSSIKTAPENEDLITEAQPEVDTTDVDAQENMETILAVASLQNIEVPKAEPQFTEKERKDMEALRMAVESITEPNSTNEYDADEIINDVSAENSVIPLETEESTSKDILDAPIADKEAAVISLETVESSTVESIHNADEIINDVSAENSVIPFDTVESSSKDKLDASVTNQETSVIPLETVESTAVESIIEPNSTNKLDEIINDVLPENSTIPLGSVESPSKDILDAPVADHNTSILPLEAVESSSKVTLNATITDQEASVGADQIDESNVDTEIPSTVTVETFEPESSTVSIDEAVESTENDILKTVNQKPTVEDSVVETDDDTLVSSETIEETKAAQSSENSLLKLANETKTPVSQSVEFGEETEVLELTSTKFVELTEVTPDSSETVSENEAAPEVSEIKEKVRKSERFKRHKKSADKLEELSINVDVPDREKLYSPKVTIKPIKVPDEEVSTTSNTDLEMSKGSLKMTISKQSDKMHTIKMSDSESVESSQELEESVSKAKLKTKPQSETAQKMFTRSSKQVTTTSVQRSGSPRITFKPVVKPEEKQEALSPLKIKIGIKPEESAKKHSPKLNLKNMKPDEEQKEICQSPRKVTIKPIVKPPEETEQSPRITIKPIVKPDIEKETPVSTPKLNIKPIKKPEEEEVEPEKERSSPKITIKPIIKPQEIETQSEDIEDEGKQRIVLKINKGNLPPKDGKKRDHSQEDDKSEKRAKITVKISKEGGHHVVHQEELSKRPLEEPNPQEKNKKQKVEIDSIISTRSKHKETVELTSEIKSKVEVSPIETRSKYKEPSAESPSQVQENPISPGSKHKDQTNDIGIEPKRPKLRESRQKENIEQKNDEHDVKVIESKIEPKVDSPIVISEDSRSQDSAGSCVIIEETPKNTPVSDTPTETAKPMPEQPIIPVPRKRGRPRKVPLEVRQEFTDQENPESKKDGQPTTPTVHDSGRPKRSCRGQSALDTLGLKPRKPRGPGRGRGSARGMGTRAIPMKPEKEPKLSKTKLKLMQRAAQAQLKRELKEAAARSNLLKGRPVDIEELIAHSQVEKKYFGKSSEGYDELKASTSQRYIDGTGRVIKSEGNLNIDERNISNLGNSGTYSTLETCTESSRLVSSTVSSVEPISQKSAEQIVKQGRIIDETIIKFESKTLVSEELTSLTVSQAEAMLVSEITLPVANSAKFVSPDINNELSLLSESPITHQARGTTVPSEVVMVDEETRMSADICSRAQTPAKQMVAPADVIIEESQSSTTTEGSKAALSRSNKAPRLEVQEPEGAVISADQLTEYYWNNNGPFMLQEQVAQYLGIKSFKRKYPSIKRRMVDMQERDFIKENGLASEHMCDLGLTAVNSADILDIMYSDFQDKYEEYCKNQRDKQTKDLINKQKAMALAASQDKTKDITEQAIKSAAQWNANFNKTRKEHRRTCMDLQTLTVHYPKGRIKKIDKPKVGNYPVALVPGQFTDYYQEFTPTEINNLPLNTMCYTPINRIPPDESDDSGSGSDSDSDSSTSSSSSGSDSSSGVEDCKLCKHSPKKGAATK